MARDAARPDNRHARTHDRRGNRVAERAPDFGMWARDTAQKLVQHNHRLQDIAEYPLERVVTLLAAIDRAEARQRVCFVTDMATVVGGIFGGGKELTEHLETLQEVIKGE